jgi:hypothetical protein
MQRACVEPGQHKARGASVETGRSIRLSAERHDHIGVGVDRARAADNDDWRGVQ